MQPKIRRVAGADGITLNLLEWSSDGIPLLFLHGFGNEAHIWDDFAPVVAPHYRTLAMDHRGHGDSDWDAEGRYEHDAMVDDVETALDALGIERFVLVGHSLGGQLPGLLDNASIVDGMVTLSAQSGYWRLQGGVQKFAVLFHAYVSLPVFARLWGYAPWSRLGLGEDLPKPVALQWAGWLRKREYLLGDDSLPLERYDSFTAPVLAYSFTDDDWGTARAVDAMMKAYPNVERRDVAPSDFGLASIGHLGFFRPRSELLWRDVIEWLRARG